MASRPTAHRADPRPPTATTPVAIAAVSARITPKYRTSGNRRPTSPHPQGRSQRGAALQRSCVIEVIADVAVRASGFPSCDPLLAVERVRERPLRSWRVESPAARLRPPTEGCVWRPSRRRGGNGRGWRSPCRRRRPPDLPAESVPPGCGLHEFAPVVGAEKAETVDAVAHRNLVGGLSLAVGLDQLFVV